MKGSLVWLPLHRTRCHRTDHLLLHFHTTSTMMPRAHPAVTPPPVLRKNWETLAQVVSRWSKPPDIDACPQTVFIHLSVLRRKLKSLLPLGFEAQTKKPSWWFCGPNHQTTAAYFRPKPGNPSEWFCGQTTRTVATGFEAKPGETINLGFEVEPRNSCSSSPCAQCRPHTASPYLSIVWTPSIRPVLDHPGPLHQVSYSCLDPHRCPPCCTCHLHITRQANMFLHMK
jgi:hypothetical protein